MHFLNALPDDLFCLVVEHLVISIGLYKAVQLRTVSRSFDAAILQAVCVSQVVDIQDPAYQMLALTMPPALKGRIYLVKSRSPGAKNCKHLTVIAEVNRALDALTRPSDARRVEQHHQIAEAVASVYPAPFWVLGRMNESIETPMEAHNLLCGTIVLGDLAIVEKVYLRDSSLETDLNRQNPYFGRPLTLAAAWGHLSVVKYLLDHGADPRGAVVDEEDEVLDWQQKIPNLRTSDVFFFDKRPFGSALRAAALRGHGDIARLLLEPKHRLPATSPEYLRAIVAAARGGHIELIELLLQTMGKKLKEICGLGEQMLWEAVRHGRVDVVQMLLQQGENVNSYPYPNSGAANGTLCVAASQGNTRMVQVLLDQGADVNYVVDRCDNTSVDCAARCGQEEVVKILLDHGADPVRALRSAAGAGQAHVVRLLLARDAELPKRDDGDAGRTALRVAIMAKNPTVISLMVGAGVSLNHGYESIYELPIFMAKIGAAQWIVDFLISLGADDRDFEMGPIDASRFNEEDISKQRLVGGVRVTRRTWEWVGKY